jgi:hypothetical protein
MLSRERRWNAECAFALGLVIALAGCKSSGGPKPTGEKPEAPKSTAEVPAPAEEVPAALKGSFTGRWTRGDGLVFDVADDGSTIKGTLESDPKGTYDSFTFVLNRSGRGLVGKASFKEKAGVAAETAWTVTAADGGNLVGENETVSVDPDTGEVADFLGRHTEKQPFAVVRPPAPSPAPEPPKPEAPKPEATPAPEAPKPEMTPEAPKPEMTPEAPKPEMTPEAPKPEMTPEAPKPEAPKPEMTPEAPKPEATPEAPKPNMTSEAPKPEMTPEAPKPETPAPETPKTPAPEAPKVGAPAPDAPKAASAPKPAEAPADLVKLIFDALHSRNEATLRAFLPTRDELVTAVGEANADKVLDGTKKLLDKQYGSSLADNPRMVRGDFVESHGPDAAKMKLHKDGASEVDHVQGWVLVYSVDGEKKEVALGRFFRVGDGGWKILSLLAPKK